MEKPCGLRVVCSGEEQHHGGDRPRSVWDDGLALAGSLVWEGRKAAGPVQSVRTGR